MNLKIGGLYIYLLYFYLHSTVFAKIIIAFYWIIQYVSLRRNLGRVKFCINYLPKISDTLFIHNKITKEPEYEKMSNMGTL
jgi:hypothetical protein